METSLVEIVEQNGLEKTQAQTILDQFSGFFEQAKTLEEEARSIVVTDESQVEDMKRARVARLTLKDIRVNAEKVRKALKEDSLRKGKAIDGIANVIKALVVPIEEYLESQERFAEFRETERKEKKLAERVSLLQQYVPDTNMYNLKEMSDDGFEQLLVSSKAAREAQIAAEEKAERDRLAKEKAEREENERIRIENEKLRADALAKKNADELAEKERIKEREAQQAKIDAEAKKAREAEEKLEEIQKEKEKAKVEAEEKQRQEKLAPEKDKLFAYAESIKSLKGPEGLSLAGQKVVENVEKKMLELSQYVKDQLKNL